MTQGLLFQLPVLLIVDEWFSSAIGIAITYVVFIMGVPTLIFQTFIPNALRKVYNERLVRNRWIWFFAFQILLVLSVFFLSNADLRDDLQIQYSSEKSLEHCIFGIITLILLVGLFHLTDNFRSSRNIEQRLSKKIVNEAIRYFDKHKQLNKKELDDLGLLAREFPLGRTKNILLEECERLVEHLLNAERKDTLNNIIGEILNKAVSLSVTYDGAQFNNENMLKALDILMLTHSRIHRRNNGTEQSNTYLNTIIGNCMKEIGIVAMRKNDLAAVMDAIEKLAPIESTSKEMFDLGNNALQHGFVQAAVLVVRKLDGKVRESLSLGQPLAKDDKRICFSWLGLVAKIDQLDGTAREFAQRRLDPVIHSFGERRAELQSLFKDTQEYFYKLADFATVDAVRALEERVV